MNQGDIEIGKMVEDLAEDVREAEASDNTPQNRFPFEAMNLKVGDRLQAQPPEKLSTERFIVRLIGYVHNTSLLVTAPMAASGQRLLLLGGEKLVMRVFSGQNAFAFASEIERVCKLPFNYLHLSFPGEVEGTVIRKAPRVRTKIIASVTTADNSSTNTPAVISNVSAHGALLDARRTLAVKGDAITLSFRVKLHNIENQLTLKAYVRTVFSDEVLDQADTTLAHFGLEFFDLQPNDFMILQGMIYQQMIERPHTVT
jgi:hypothetical protein